MLRRIDRDVPNGTDIAILQPGGNDRRFLVTREQRAANIAQMQRRLRARGIEVIVYDEEIPVRYYTLDFIHLTREGHAMMRCSAHCFFGRACGWSSQPLFALCLCAGGTDLRALVRWQSPRARYCMS